MLEDVEAKLLSLRITSVSESRSQASGLWKSERRLSPIPRNFSAPSALQHEKV